MPVQWRDKVKSRGGPMFITCPPNRFVCILTKPCDHAVVVIHYVESMGGSYPCLGQSCTFCPAPKREAAYAPALMWSKSIGKWIQGILPLGSPSSQLYEIESDGVPIEIGKSRDPSMANRTIFLGTLKTLDSLGPVPTVKPFDVRPPLLRRWGLFKEAELMECTYHEADPTLQFPTEDVG